MRHYIVTRPVSSVRFEGHQCSEFIPERGLREGCQLSASYYCVSPCLGYGRTSDGSKGVVKEELKEHKDTLEDLETRLARVEAIQERQEAYRRIRVEKCPDLMLPQICNRPSKTVRIVLLCFTLLLLWQTAVTREWSKNNLRTNRTNLRTLETDSVGSRQSRNGKKVTGVCEWRKKSPVLDTLLSSVENKEVPAV